MDSTTDRLAYLPPPAAPVFRATVHGLAFADRTRHLRRLAPGGEVVVIPDPPGSAVEKVWIHLVTGDPIGHLPHEIGTWLAPWMRRGGKARARVLRVGDESVPSWKRLLVEVTCLA